MTGKEKLLAVLSGKIPDSVPVAPFVQEEFLSYIYPEKEVLDRVIDGAICAREFGFDLMARPHNFSNPYFLKKSYPNWRVEQAEEKRDGNIYRTTKITTPLRTLIGVEVGPDLGAASKGVHLSNYEYFIKDEEDAQAFIEYMPDIDDEVISDMKLKVDEWEQVIGDIGIVVPWGWGTVYNHASVYRNVELLLMDAYINPELYSKLMNKVADSQCKWNKELIKAGIKCIGFQANIANGSMVGYDFYKEHIQPYEQKLVDAVKAEGGFVLFHNCGYAKALYNNYIELGIDAWETVSEYPTGDNVLSEVKEGIGKKMTIIGNLDQIHFLKTASPDEIYKKAQEIMQIGKVNGRYIFAASDYIELNTPIKNFKAMIEGARSTSGYQSEV